ncbi:aspartyl protease family protein [Olivibacter sitiensis]|uniref:aspartyl protease family protein n=1 Tax=Olivibacter sitiensis TaxID=376470 RepID=UPI0004093301|nr:aspartyl protease family protein [Olivibacter sitiensis]
MIKIPLEVLQLEDGVHLLVELFAFGKSFKAVLDTGASKTVFDKTTIENYLDGSSLITTDRVSTGLGTTNMESFLWNVSHLKIGDLELSDIEVAILDLSTINYAYANMNLEPVIGVIGGDLLSQYKAVIDYGKGTLSLKKPRYKRT